MPKHKAITATTTVAGYDAAITPGPKKGLFNAYLRVGADNPWTPTGFVEIASYPVTYFDGDWVGVDSFTSEAQALETLNHMADVAFEKKKAQP